jgi:outer membrane lipoprotein SlyB
MTKQLVPCLVAIVLGCILEGCATDHQAAGDNSNYLENTNVTAHGVATVSYGHSVGH